MESIVSIKAAYPKMGKNTFKSALWTFKQQLTLKMGARYGISNLAPVNILVPLLSGYVLLVLSQGCHSMSCHSV